MHQIFSPAMVGESCFIIAEAGVNHNGRLDLAYELIRQAKQVGANAVKFQLFDAKALVTSSAPLAGYQEGCADSQLSMLEALELPPEMYPELKRYAESLGLIFLCSPFDEDSASFLVHECRVPMLKIASGEITNLPLLRHLKTLQTPLILSTGMSSLVDIREALSILNDQLPLCLLHCVSAYPTPIAQSNLLAIQTLKEQFPEHGIGFSDHTTGQQAAIIARSLGAQVIEKHLTLDNTLAGPDHKTSLNPEAFAQMVQAIRDTEAMLGTGIKVAQNCEADCLQVARKSLVSTKALPAGHLLRAEDLTAKRPGTGYSPMRLDDIIGQRLSQAIQTNTVISPQLLDQTKTSPQPLLAMTSSNGLRNTFSDNRRFDHCIV